MANYIFSNLDDLGTLIAAAAALGTASMGLLDATKSIGGGPSNLGFGSIRRALEPFLLSIGDDQSFEVTRRGKIFDSLKSSWITGVPLADQKAKARALVHLHLRSIHAQDLARLAGVDPTDLAVAFSAIDGAGTIPDKARAAMARFDAVLAAAIDDGYGRADQIYRNGAKAWAMVIALGVAFIGLIFSEDSPDGTDWFKAFLVGIIAVPVAPVAKNLASLLQAAKSIYDVPRK